MAETTFRDGLKSFLNSLVNRRSASSNNAFVIERLDTEVLKEIYKTGIGSKIVRLKVGYALKDSLVFESSEDEKFYKRILAKKIKLAGYWMLAFGRGIVVIHEKGKRLSEPLSRELNLNRVKFDVFSGDMITAFDAVLDLSKDNYLKPTKYQVRDAVIDHSRVVDFKYVPVPELDAPDYQYGGISEYQLIYDQLINDGIIERSSAHIIEKNSNIFYKIKDFKSLLQAKQEKDLLKYFQKLEDHRSIYGAGIIDAEDEVMSIAQSMTDLEKVDTISLRRLAMVTGIPVAVLVGENVKGLNSSGDNEMEIFWNMIDELQENYFVDPINEIMTKIGKNEVGFKETFSQTPAQKMEYEVKAIAAAFQLWQMGLDAEKYLVEKNVIEKDDLAEFFKE